MKQLHIETLLSGSQFNVLEPMDEADLSGKVIALFFWNHADYRSIQFMLATAKHFQKYYFPKVICIGVHIPYYEEERDDDCVEQFIARHNIEFPVVNDSNCELLKQLEIKDFPAIALWDSWGRKRGCNFGFNIDRKKVNEAVVSLVNEGIKAKAIKQENSIIINHGLGSEKFFSFPQGLVVDSKKNLIAISDTGHHRVFITDLNGKIESIIGVGEKGDEEGNISSCKFHSPTHLCLIEDLLFVSDPTSQKVKCVDLKSETVKTIMGTGIFSNQELIRGRGIRTSLASPTDMVAVLEQDKHLNIILCNSGNAHTLKYDLNTDILETHIGKNRYKYTDDAIKYAGWNQPISVCRGPKNFLFFVDQLENAIRFSDGQKIKSLVKFPVELGEINKNTELNRPVMIRWDSKNTLYIVDSGNHRIMSYNIQTKQWLRHFESSGLNYPMSIALLNDNEMLISDTYNHRVVKANIKENTVSEFSLFYKREEDELSGWTESLPKLVNLSKESDLELYEGRELSLEIKLLLDGNNVLSPEHHSKISIYESHKGGWYKIRNYELHMGQRHKMVNIRNVNLTQMLVVDLEWYQHPEGSAHNASVESQRFYVKIKEKGPKGPVQIIAKSKK